MNDRIEMRHRDYPGAIAHPRASEVPTWEAKGWTVCPARGATQAKKRALKPATVKGQNND